MKLSELIQEIRNRKDLEQSKKDAEKQKSKEKRIQKEKDLLGSILTSLKIDYVSIEAKDAESTSFIATLPDTGLCIALSRFQDEKETISFYIPERNWFSDDILGEDKFLQEYAKAENLISCSLKVLI